jgi:hypothetical protein
LREGGARADERGAREESGPSSVETSFSLAAGPHLRHLVFPSGLTNAKPFV